MSEPELLLYRSNLLGADKRITNYGGGNTSAKVMEADPLTGETGRSALGQGLGRRRRLDPARRLRDALHGQARGAEGPLPRASRSRTRWWAISRTARSTSTRAPPRSTRRCTPTCRASTSTTCMPTRSSPSRPRRTRKALTSRSSATRSAGCRGSGPATSSGSGSRSSAARTRDARGVVLESHGLFTWGDDAQSCYDTTIEVINRAIEWLEERTAGKPPFGGTVATALPAEERRRIAARLMPAIRGMVVEGRAHGRPFRRPGGGARVRQRRRTCRALAALGTSCPDHFLRTKIRPLVVDFDPAAPDLDATLAGLAGAVEAYRQDYAAYYERCRRAGQPGDARPERRRLPGARRRHDHLRRATRRRRGSRRVLRQRHQRDARRLGGLGVPGPAGAGGLRHRVLAARGGEAAAHAEAEEPRRAHRAGHRRRRRHRLGDRRALPRRGRLRGARRYRRGRARRDRGEPRVAPRRGRRAHRRDERDLRGGGRSRLRELAVEFGGLDILVSNAGIASSAPIEDDDARALEPQHGDPLDRLFPGRRARPSRRCEPRASAARSSSSARRTGSPPRRAPPPTARPRRPSCTSRAASRSRARRTASASTW